MTDPDIEAPIRKALRRSLAAVGTLLIVVVCAYLWLRPPEPKNDVPEYAVRGPLQPAKVAVAPPSLPFADITSAAGIDFVHTNGAYGARLMPETMGGGVAFFDYDSDGHQDLLFINSKYWPGHAGSIVPTSRLYRGHGDGTFDDVTTDVGLGINLYGMGVATGDYDGDGFVDVFVTAFGRNRLFRNIEGKKFVDVTDQAGVAGADDAWSTCATFFDYDRDGDLDLFVCNYVRWTKKIDQDVEYRLAGIGRTYAAPDDLEGTYSYLYRNDGGTFTDVSLEAGIKIRQESTGVPIGKALGVLPVDINNDGWLDLVVANDMVRNFLFVNNAGQSFTESGRSAGIAFTTAGLATSGMGIDGAWRGDDRHLAIGIGNFANEMSSLYVSDGPEHFSDDAAISGIGAASRRPLTFGVLFIDADLDGREEFLQANGHIEPEINRVQSSEHYLQQLQLFWNCGKSCEHPYQPIANFMPELRLAARGAAYADIDEDGDQDLVITQTGGRAVLLRNDERTDNHYIRVELRSKSKNVYGVGASIWVDAGDIRERHDVMPTRSYLSQVELPVTFGLGKHTHVDRVTVRWPRGNTEFFDKLGVDKSYRFEEGTGTAMTRP